MKNLKKMNFKELNSSEMKQVQGGGLLRQIVRPVREGDVIAIPSAVAHWVNNDVDGLISDIVKPIV